MTTTTSTIPSYIWVVRNTSTNRVESVWYTRAEARARKSLLSTTNTNSSFRIFSRSVSSDEMRDMHS